MLSVIIPAHNEEAYLGACLSTLLRQDVDVEAVGGVDVIVAANGCTDGTAAVAEAMRPAFLERGFELLVLHIAAPGKLNALNEADAYARGDIRIYLDADIECDPALLRQLHEALDTPEPRYASGRLSVTPARTFVTRCFGKVWARLPFMKSGVVGAGVFAVNAAGRRRWAAFPDIIADDMFVRLQFTPRERVGVDARFYWPMVEGPRALVKVRGRQDRGVREIAARYPDLMKNEAKADVRPKDHLKLFAQTPISYLVYVAIVAAARVQAGRSAQWARGR